MNSRPSSRPLPATALAVLACVLVGVLALYYGTAGFRVVSTEAGRRLAIAAQPVTLPPTQVRRAVDAGVLSLAADLSNDRRATIITFVYTRCQAICRSVGTELQQLQAQIQARGLQDKVRLMTISFDPLDDSATLAAYAQRMRADGRLWQFYGIDDGAQRKRLLDTFGIVVVPAPLGEFVHNAAYHVIDRQGRLARIVDIGAADEALDAALDAARDTSAIASVNATVSATASAAHNSAQNAAPRPDGGA